MQTSWTKFRNGFVDSVIAELWAHWTALGVGSTERFRPTVVDLEALLVGTWAMGRVEPRLFDEALGWSCRFGEHVSSKRLRKLLGELEHPTTLQIAGAWTEVVEAHGNVSIDLRESPPVESDEKEVLFQTGKLESQTTVGETDPTFERWGLVRGRYEFRENASEPDMSDRALSQLFARKFMGSGCRAEVFAILLNDVEVTTSELADMTVYSRRLVQDVLGELNESGVLDWNPGPGRTTHPTLKRAALEGFQKAWMGLRSHEEPVGIYDIRDWPGFFLGLNHLWDAILEINKLGYEGFKAESLLRDGLEAAYEFHSRTTLQAIYEPRLVSGSLEELLREAELYLDSLFPVRADAS